MKRARVKPLPNGSMPPVDLASADFDGRTAFVRRQRHLGLRRFCLARNKGMLMERGLLVRVHRKKPQRPSALERTRIANAKKPNVRSAVENVFTYENSPTGLFLHAMAPICSKLKIIFLISFKALSGPPSSTIQLTRCKIGSNDTPNMHQLLLIYQINNKMATLISDLISYYN